MTSRSQSSGMVWESRSSAETVRLWLSVRTVRWSAPARRGWWCSTHGWSAGRWQSDPAFVKGHVGRAGGGIIAVIVVVKLCGILALFPADQDQPAGGQILCAVLGRKQVGRLPDLSAPQVIWLALGGVFVQQLGDDLVLIAGLGQIINSHILRQVVGHLSERSRSGCRAPPRRDRTRYIWKEWPGQQD